jgi:2-phosphosulfolactate phosphatase
VAAWLAPAVAGGRTVTVVAAGERWPDDSLRPAAEDLWGAGAVLAALVDLGTADLSPEARVAERAFRAIEPDLVASLHGCASGRELAEAGFAADVDVAAELDAADVVPVLEGGEFVAVSN